MDAPNWHSFAHDEIGAKDRYKLLSGSVVPRPIALVTTRSEDGIANAAPISFFNVVSADPGMLILGVETRESGTAKDTATNIRLTGAFCVNLVNEAMFEGMCICAQDVGPEVDEIALAGFTPLAGAAGEAPRLLQAPVAFECARHTTLEVSASRQIVLGRITHLHFRDDVLDTERNYVRQEALKLVGRMGGNGYVRLNDQFIEQKPEET